MIAASIGPTGEFCEPLGEMTPEQMEAVFSEQIAAIYAAGAQCTLHRNDACAIDEACCAILAAKRLNASFDVICTMTFNPTPKGPRTMMGVSPEQAAGELTDAVTDIVGANCGNGIEQMIGIAAEFRKFTQVPILIHANAGVPEFVEGKTVFRQSPSDMASRVKELCKPGANHRRLLRNHAGAHRSHQNSGG